MKIKSQDKKPMVTTITIICVTLVLLAGIGAALYINQQNLAQEKLLKEKEIQAADDRAAEQRKADEKNSRDAIEATCESNDLQYSPHLNSCYKSNFKNLY